MSILIPSGFELKDASFVLLNCACDGLVAAFGVLEVCLVLSSCLAFTLEQI